MCQRHEDDELVLQPAQVMKQHSSLSLSAALMHWQEQSVHDDTSPAGCNIYEGVEGGAWLQEYNSRLLVWCLARHSFNVFRRRGCWQDDSE